MEARDILIGLTGTADIPTAARILANRVRAAVAEPLLSSTLNVDESFVTPVSFNLLMEIARSCGIQHVEFGSTIACDGELEAKEGSGFVVRILYPRYTTRARFTLAHEIGHTFFYGRGTGTRQRLAPYSRITAYGADPKKSEAIEEWFCNEFALELMLPEAASAQLTAEISQCLSPAEMLFAIERSQRRYKTTIETTLRRLNQTGGIANDILVVILRRASHVKTKRDPAVRVTALFPRPAGKWFLPPNRRAVSIGLRGANTLFDWWNSFPQREPGKEYKRRNGVFSLDEVDRSFVVYENVFPKGRCHELIQVNARRSTECTWKELTVEVPVLYRLYAMNTIDAYCAAIIDFSSVKDSVFADSNRELNAL